MPGEAGTRRAESRPVFKHPLSLVESDEIGPGTRIWAWAHVMKGARLGADCNVGEHCFIEAGAVLGDRVTVKNGVAVWEGVAAEDDVFLGPNAVLTNDLRPRSKVYREKVEPTLLKRGASIGANATILCGITIGEYAMIGAGAVVTKDVPSQALVLGNPGRVVGHVCRCGGRLGRRGRKGRCEACHAEYTFSGRGMATLVEAI
jgi:UDP-2-acetamido-3-amino-2,3-dideoxy-glucuronate N-acetyltransferase